METPKQPVYVLAVDDQEEDLALVRDSLEREGMRVATAASCAEASRRLSEGSYEVLVVDLKLPDGDGLDLLTAAQENDPHTVAVVLTGHTSVQTTVASLRRGAYDFLTKPCPAETLAASVRRAAEKHRLSRTLSQRTKELESMNQELDKRVQDATRQIFFLNERLKRFIVGIMESNEARVRFMDNVTHELKNPLSVVWGYTSHLLKRPIDAWTKEEVERSLQAMHRNADLLNGLLEELSEATRLSNHKLRLNRGRLDAYAEAAGAAESFRTQAEEKGIFLVSDCPPCPGPILEADPRRLRQILSNLLSNALKFTPKGGRITVSAKPSGTSVHFCVQDTGPGIAPEHLNRVFDRFYQVESAHHHKGLGLGLEITKGLVTLHGGTIWAESEPGKGARFHFSIPCSAPKDADIETPLPRAIGRPH